MVKIPGVDPLSEGTICRKQRKSSMEEVVTGAPSATVSVPPPDDVAVIEGQEVQTQTETEKAAVTPGSAPAPASEQKKDSGITSMSTGAKPKTPAALKLKEDFHATYMSKNQCVCGFQAADGHALHVHTKNQHPHGYYRCWGLLKSSTTGQERRCPYETDDQGVMWRHYRAKHLGLYYQQCSAEKCTAGKDGKRFMSDNPDAVTKHMSKYHSTEASLTCPHCKKYVASAKYMLEHHMWACSTKDKKVKFHHCYVCGKGFCDWDTFSHHKLQMHSEVPDSTAGWYFCGECDKKFVASSSHAHHIRKVHTPVGEKSG